VPLTFGDLGQLAGQPGDVVKSCHPQDRTALASTKPLPRRPADMPFDVPPALGSLALDARTHHLPGLLRTLPAA